MEKIFSAILNSEARGMRGIGVRLARGILWIFSLAYAGVIQLVVVFYATGIFRAQRIQKPVISVGNLTWGGAGKTPLVILIAEFIKAKGLKPAILMRGYKGKNNVQGEMFNDEALLLREALPDVPILVGKNRLQAANAALKEYPVDVFILDDGFQHRHLQRDCDIVAINATNPWGNGQLIPRGNLREPLSVLSRADLFVITKSDLGQDQVSAIKAKLAAIKNIPVIETVHQPAMFQDLCTSTQYALTTIREKSIVALSSIADPSSFRKTLESLGGKLQNVFTFDDHHWYQKEELQKIISDCQRLPNAVLITTAKDAVKLREYRDLFRAGPTCLVLKMKIQITKGNDEFFNRINFVLQR